VRVILVPLRGEAHDRAALAAAHHVARPYQAHITGLFIRPDPVEAIGVLQGISAEMVDRVTRPATTTWNKGAGLAKQAFDEARASTDAALADPPTGMDTVTAPSREVTAGEDVLLAGHVRLADLVVSAGARADDAIELKEHFATALFNTARPILLIPERGIEDSPRTVAIAWSGSAESTRALSGALPLLLEADRLHVLTAAAPRTRVESDAALAEYLGWQGLIGEIHPMYPENEVGLARAAELGADLLVTGGYGRSRMRERIFGGVTQHVLDHHDTCPVLIVH
jgi:nucleotide-binding universal stress UspA family protein